MKMFRYILTTRVIQHIRCHCRNYPLVHVIFCMCFDNTLTTFRQCFGNTLINKNQLPLDIHSYKRNIDIILQTRLLLLSKHCWYTRITIYYINTFTRWQCNLVSYYILRTRGSIVGMSMSVYRWFTELEIDGACP